MDFGLTPQQESLRQEVARFCQEETTAEVIAELESGIGIGAHYWKFLRKAGARGWLAPTWPREYGGIESTYIERFIIAEEMSYYGALLLLHGAHIAGPSILLFGTEEQKRRWLPGIARGETEFAVGYSEPQAGSDLASLQMRAVEDGDDYVVSGQKMYNTACHYAQYHWLGVRTDPNAPKHKGISLLVVDLKSPGVTIRPLWTFAGVRTNEVFYDQVRVPKTNLVGQVNRGFYHIATALDFERMFTTGRLRRHLEELVGYMKETGRDGKPLSQNPLLRGKVAELAIELDIARLIAFRVAWMLDQGTVPNYESSVLKLFTTEVWTRLFRLGMEVMGLYGQLTEGSKLAPLGGRFPRFYLYGPMQTVVAGTSEIMRSIIALRGLGLPAGY